MPGCAISDLPEGRPALRSLPGWMLPITCALIMAAAAPARGDGEGAPILSDRFGISAGSYFANLRTSLQVGRAGVLGSLVTMEGDLNLEEETTDGRYDLFYRINPRHTLESTVIVIGRDGRRSIDREIQFQDFLFAVNAEVETKFDSRLFKLAYRYSFLNDGRVETGIIAGLSTFSYEISMSGQASAGTGTPIQLRTAAEDVLAPIPTFGIFTSCAVRPRLIFRGSAELFYVNVGDISGRLIDAKLTFDYFPTRRFGLGLGVAGTSVGLNYSSGSKSLDVDYRYSGPLIYLQFVM